MNDEFWIHSEVLQASKFPSTSPITTVGGGTADGALEKFKMEASTILMPPPDRVLCFTFRRGGWRTGQANIVEVV